MEHILKRNVLSMPGPEENFVRPCYLIKFVAIILGHLIYFDYKNNFFRSTQYFYSWLSSLVEPLQSGIEP